MLTHQEIWRAIDNLAEKKSLSTSGLAKKAGLDPTSFNKSKRFSPDGKPRWPSMESVAKILDVCDASLSDLDMLKQDAGTVFEPQKYSVTVSIPLLSLEDVVSQEALDEDGVLNVQDPDYISFPFCGQDRDPHIYALEITSETLAPKYEEGDILLIAPSFQKRRGDNVVLKTKQSGDLVFGQIRRLTDSRLDLLNYFQPEHPVIFDNSDIIWISRILWASQ